MEPTLQLPSNSDIYSVKEFNELVNTVLTQEIGEVTIQGEVSGFQVRQGKWVSFDLKDKESCINCFMGLYQLDMPLTDGQEVIVTGTARVYVPYGKYSFTARNVQLCGEGAIQKAFEELKKKLLAEGLFDPKYKKPVPRFPHTIGIITSKEGAAINDIQKVLAGRMGGLELYLAPVLVQGKNAVDDLCGALHYFNAYQPVDVIIFGRGGGSLEDLQAFNSEKVARAIFASKIPVISGIGHEHNTSIADLVADVRAATPSNAAELCVQDRIALQRHIDTLKDRMERGIAQQINDYRSQIQANYRLLPQLIEQKLFRVKSLVERFSFSLDYSQRSVAQERQRISQYCDKIYQKTELAISHSRQRLHRFGSMVQALTPKQAVAQERAAVAHLIDKLYSCTDQVVALANRRKDQVKAMLDVLSPERVLERGYTITYDAETNVPLTTYEEAQTKTQFITRFAGGKIASATSGTPVIPLKIKPTKQPKTAQPITGTISLFEEEAL